MEVINVNGYKFNSDAVIATKNGKWVKADYNGKSYFLKSTGNCNYPLPEELCNEDAQKRKRAGDLSITDRFAVYTEISTNDKLKSYCVVPTRIFISRNRVCASSQWLDESGMSLEAMTKLSPGQKLKIAYSVLQAVGKLHDCCLVHGDIRLSNVMIICNPNISIKLLGFDYANFTGRSVKSDSITSYYDYLCDELYACKCGEAESAILTASADAFSCGILLYQLWTGILLNSRAGLDSSVVDKCDMPIELYRIILALLNPDSENRMAVREGAIILSEILKPSLEEAKPVQKPCEALPAQRKSNADEVASAETSPLPVQPTQEAKTQQESIAQPAKSEQEPTLVELLRDYKQLNRGLYTRQSLDMLDYAVNMLADKLRTGEGMTKEELNGYHLVISAAFGGLMEEKTVLDYSRSIALCKSIVAFAEATGNKDLIRRVNAKLVAIFSKCKSQNVTQKLIDKCYDEANEFYFKIKLK